MKTIAILLISIATAISGYTQNFRSGEKIVISTRVEEDLYLAAGNITVNAPVYGDLVVGGGTVTINDTVTGDVLVAGGNVTINGYVGDDIRGAAGEIYVNNYIAGDLVVSGGTLNVAKTSAVAGNVLLGGGEILFAGNAGGNIKGAGGKMKFSGTAEKDLIFKGEQLTVNGMVKGKSSLAANDIVIGGQASFYNDVQYWNRKHVLDFKETIKDGAPLFEPDLEININKWHYLGFSSFLGVVWYLIAVYVVILLLQYLFRPVFRSANIEVTTHASRSLFHGFLFFVLVPIGILLLMITIIGIPIGIIALIAYIILAALATAICAVSIAHLISKRASLNWKMWQHSLFALGVFIVLKLVSLVPVVGWLFMFVVACIFFGALMDTLWKKRNSSNLAASEIS